jgi:hypothetical protein
MDFIEDLLKKVTNLDEFVFNLDRIGQCRLFKAIFSGAQSNLFQISHYKVNTMLQNKYSTIFS